MLMLASSAITYFQAIVLGVLQGVTELFPVSSLGHTVLFPTLFGWNEVVRCQSESESPWLAFVVTLHVGSALGLLFYYRRDWVEIIKAFFHTLATRRAETSTERLAWLIIIASIPAGVLGLAFEHQLRTLTAKPEVAAIFLMVNGLVLFAAERFRRRAAVRELAVREGLNPEGGARARHARVSRVARHRRRPVDRPDLRNQPRRRRNGGGTRARSRPQRLGAFRVPARHADHPRRGPLQAPDLLGHLGNGIRGQAVVACISAAITAVFTVAFLVKYFKTRTLIPFAIYCLIFGLFMVVYTQVS